MNILDQIISARSRGHKLLARLIDPDDSPTQNQLERQAVHAEHSGVDYIFFGGSLITQKLEFDPVTFLRNITRIPIVLFPSSAIQINSNAHAFLFLSLISGRNPEYLIGQHVAAAPLLRKLSLEIIPTGYILVGCGKPTTAEYVSHTFPIPHNKPEISAATALAGQMLGMKLLYLDGGSGAEKPISAEMVTMVREWTSVPVIVGGGIRSADMGKELYQAGADMVVVGNGIESNPDLLRQISDSRYE